MVLLVTYLVIFFTTHVVFDFPSLVSAAELGGKQTGYTLLTKDDSPHFVTMDVVVEPEATVEIEPGAELRFNPGTGLKVHGTLTAVGTASNRIIFTKSSGGSVLDSPPQWPADIRLANGSDVLEGVIQVPFKGQWRSICANSANWTALDAKVVCNQLGFASAVNDYFTYNFTATDYHSYIAISNPSCTGSESSVSDCPGSKAPMYSSQICRNQRSLYLKCQGLRADLVTDYWDGLKFYNTTFVRVRSSGDSLNESTSVLQYADILYAGVTKDMMPTAAISASPFVPKLLNVRVMFNAYDAINFTEINSTTIIEDSEIAHNRGHGLNVTTSFGRVRIKNSQFLNNRGNGLYVRTVDKIFRRWEWSTGDFCLASQSSAYPQLYTGVAPSGRRDCPKRFVTGTGRFITISILEMEKDPIVNSATLKLYNGDCLADKSRCGTSQAPLLQTWEFKDLGTIGLPQSEVTTQHMLTMLFTLDDIYNRQNQCAKVAGCVRFVLLLTSSDGRASEDLILQNVIATENNLHGALIENPRSFIKVSDSQFSMNEYGAGFRIRGGAADLDMSNTIMDDNANSGLNITYSGGRRILTDVKARRNNGIGMYIDYVHEHKSREERHQKTEFINVRIEDNSGIGLRVGNYCADSVISINQSSSISRNGAEGIHVLSCYGDTDKTTNFSMRDSFLTSNRYQAIKISPMLSMIGHMRKVAFKEHSRGVILMDNTADLQRNRVFLNKLVEYDIDDNSFTNNSGPYVVNMRLTETGKQNLTFQFNRLTGNHISLSETILKPRSRARAVVVVSSSNVVVNNNELVNRQSDLEICTHSTDTAITINASMNWWGTDTVGEKSVKVDDDYYKRIVGRIIDQETRYNLARVKYFPVLLSDTLNGNSGVGAEDPRQFSRVIDGVRYLGGQMKADFTTDANTEYIVDSDINIVPNKEFKLSKGTVLQFDNTVGVLVRGKMYGVGTEQQPIVLKRRDEENPHANITWIRFTGGDDALGGVLELNITGEWSTVCNKGWTMREASVVCQQFGYTLQPDSWIVPRPPIVDKSQPITYSYVKCMHSDSDIIDCIHDEESEFNDCTHEDDVTMRCVPPTWAGIKLVASSRQSELRHVTIEEAGLLDYFTNEFVPALEVDKNYHLFSDLHITRSSSTGMSIVYSEPFGSGIEDISTVNTISRSTFSDNLGDGLNSKSSYLTLEDCVFTRNSQSGFTYDPKLSLLTAFNVRKAISSDQITDINTKINNTKIKIEREGAVKYFQAINTGARESYTVLFELQAAEPNQRVTVQVLDYSPETYIEKLIIYDSNRADINLAQQIAIDEDNVDLPLVSSSDTLTLSYFINGTKSGRLMLSVSSKAQNDVPDMSGTVPHNVRATIRLTNCELTDNKRGILLTHYNNPSNEHMDIFIRTKYEQVILDNVTVTGNSEEAMFVPSVTKYNEVYMPNVQLLEASHRMANITYYIRNSKFSNNGRGILAEHNHVDYSNNMWRWKFVNNLVSANRAGGLQIELPLILDPYSNGNHSIEINGSRFEENEKFEFAINGGFANLSLYQNSFQRNTASEGLIRLTGTEKDMFISGNEIINNRGKFMMDIDISSHSEFGVNQPAVVYKNLFRDNDLIAGSQSGTRGEEATVTGYTLALRGVQKVNITRNLFTDKLPFTFVADVPSTSLTTEVNVRQNYWSTTNQSVIREKIFDFSDWSSYAIANYTGFLLANSYDAQASGEAMDTVVFNLQRPLGGIISSDLTIPYRDEDYRVVSDITIQSGVTVQVEAGVTFRINPSIGFLVLGRLLANGLSNNKIRFLPVERQATEARSVRYRRQQDVYFAPPNITSADGLCRATAVSGLRLCGGENEKEGFIKMYNTTINAWSLVCDPQFNDRTAEVFCRSMNFYSGNVAVRYSELYEYFTFGRDRDRYKDLWTRTYLCKGDEDHIDECGQKTNYNLQKCSLRREYVFIRCGERNLDSAYDFWGNLRFATYSAEAAVDDIARSALRNVEIAGAGVLHGNKVSAVMSTYQTPSTYNLDIHDCADGGLDFISPRSDVFLLNSNIRNNLGTALNILVLNGEKGEDPSKFKPLNSSSVPYRVFGMIDMCDSQKVIDVDRRVLVYYKYDFESISCVKVFRNIHKTQLNIRFLQVNLFQDDFSRNLVEVFDGPDFVDHLKLKDIRADSTEQEKRSVYKTTYYYNVEFKEKQLQYQMGLHIHAGPASGIHGFIAEITTSSSSYTGAEGVHKVIGNLFYKNYGGSMHYSTVGETNPGIVVTGNLFRENGLDVLNLTSTENVLLEAQNVPALSVSNNMFVDNNGSCTLWLSADGDASKVVRGNVSNNIFYRTVNGEALRIYGNSYQEVMVLFNYVASNIVDNLNTVDLRYVIVNVTGNTLFRNQGAHGMDVWSNNDITFSKQHIELNQFYGNFPGDKFKDSQHGGNNTMLYTAGHYSNKRIRNNWFENKFYFELSTHNRTSTNEKPARDPTMKVDAQYNYWGHKIGVDNTDLIIRARMHDYRDDTNLSMIDYTHFYADNISLPQMEGSYETGYCLVGWKLTVSQRCYRYYGGIATYDDAEAICALENATIAKPNNQFWVEIGQVIQYTQQDYSEQVRAWVDEPEKVRPVHKCSVVIDSRYDEADCTDRLPFVCESDQIGALSSTWRDWLYLWVIIGIGCFLILLALVFVVFWWRKSKLRKDQRLERRASLRSSIRSNKYAINNGALTQGSQTNIATSLYGSRNALANRPMARGRATNRDATHSIALTDFTLGETDVDLDDTETVATKKNGYSSTGYAGSADSSRQGSRDDLSQVSHPMRRDSPIHATQDDAQLIHAQTPPRVTPRPQSEYSRYKPRALPQAIYNNEGYSTDSSPKHEPVQTAEQYQPATVQPAPRGMVAEEPQTSEHAYINTSRLTKEPEPVVDVAEQKRRELYNQKRPTRPAPAAYQPSAEAQRPAPAAYQPSAEAQRPSSALYQPSADTRRPLSASYQPTRREQSPAPSAESYQPTRRETRQPHLYSTNQQPPGYATATREDNLRPFIRTRPTPSPSPAYRPDDSLVKRDSFSTLDTKSIDSYDSEFSMSKPPLSYRPYDHHRQYSDEKKPFETDIDSMYSEDQPDTAPFYQYNRQSPVPSSRARAAAYQPSPLTRDVHVGYDSETSSQQMYHLQPQYNSQHEMDEIGPDPSYYGGQYGGPPAETDIDAMSEMTDDWNRQGPPVETDF